MVLHIYFSLTKVNMRRKLILTVGECTPLSCILVSDGIANHFVYMQVLGNFVELVPWVYKLVVKPL